MQLWQSRRFILMCIATHRSRSLSTGRHAVGVHGDGHLRRGGRGHFGRVDRKPPHPSRLVRSRVPRPSFRSIDSAQSTWTMDTGEWCCLSSERLMVGEDALMLRKFSITPPVIRRSTSTSRGGCVRSPWLMHEPRAGNMARIETQCSYSIRDNLPEHPRSHSSHQRAVTGLLTPTTWRAGRQLHLPTRLKHELKAQRSSRIPHDPAGFFEETVHRRSCHAPATPDRTQIGEEHFWLMVGYCCLEMTRESIRLKNGRVVLRETGKVLIFPRSRLNEAVPIRGRSLVQLQLLRFLFSRSRSGSDVIQIDSASE